MAGGFERINEREANPNKHFTFITEQRTWNDAEEGRKVLRALAALFRPIMQDHGIWVKTLDEHEWNPQWAGRNWNAGEKIELVLRRSNGSFLPPQLLVYVMCHELAHCKQMNHGPAFQTLNARIRSEVRALQARGYTGDGLWSTGNILGTGAVKEGMGMPAGEIPFNICGSQSKVIKRRRKDVAGRRPKKFKGNGHMMGDKYDDHAGFRKKAASKTGREKAALAAEQRLALLEKEKELSTSTAELTDDEEEEEEVYEQIEGEAEEEMKELLKMLRQCGNVEEEEDVPRRKKRKIDKEDMSNAGTKSSGTGIVSTSQSDHIRNGARTTSITTQEIEPQLMREVYGVDDDAVQQQWECGACTLKNHVDFGRCAVCGTRRMSS